MSWDAPFQSSITTDLAALKPLHDFVLIEPFDAAPGTLIIDPGVKMTKDYRWVSPRPRGPRYGTVVAVGAGDRLIGFCCLSCNTTTDRIETAKRFTCHVCGEPLHVLQGIFHGGGLAISRADMHVKPGDVVLYNQRPANEVVLNGKKYTLHHEEQDILAVIEEEESIAA